MSDQPETQDETKLTFKKSKNPSSGAFGTTSKLDPDGRVLSTSYKTKEGVLELPFQAPGGLIPARNIRTVKAISPDGVLVQLPLENQINNNVASPEDRIGLRVYQRKGFTILFDFETGRGVYCPGSDCWAQANDAHRGACSASHEAILFHQADNAGKFGTGATTSQSWGR